MPSWFQKLRTRWRQRGRPLSLSEQYDKIAKELSPHELQSSRDDWGLTEADLFGDLVDTGSRSRRVSGYYSKRGVELALERFGLFDKVRERGFSDLRLSIDLDDPKRQHITLHAMKGREEHLLMDLMTGRGLRQAPVGLEPPDDLELHSIEWMMLQNPTKEFPPDHPRWPGQEHPGLGLNEEVMLLHVQSAKILELDGVVNHPSRYHVAVIGRGRNWFLEPEIQGRFDALQEALSALELSEATWKMERAEVRWADDGTVVEWLPEDYVVPTSDRLVAYFTSKIYEGARAESFARSKQRGIVVVAQEGQRQGS